MEEKIVVILPNWIGDVVMSLPVLHKLRRLFPGGSIRAVVRKDIFPLIEKNCNMLDVLPLFYSDKSFKDTFGLFKNIKAEKFDKCFVLPRSYRMFFLSLLSGIKEIYGYGDFFKNFFLKKSLKRDKDSLAKHRVYYYLEILKLYRDFEFDGNLYPEIFISETLDKWADTFLKENGLTGKVLIGLNPGATYGTAKCWDSEKFNELIALVSSKCRNAIFMIFGGKDNLSYNFHIKGTNILNLTGKMNLAESAALISKCNLFITNDTGPMHIADALGVNIVAIFGPTDPKETPPFRMNKNIIYKNLPCSPCKERICPLKHNKCMVMISVDEVFMEIKKVLGGCNAEV